MSAEPQIDDEHLRVLESAARGATVDLRYPRSTILSVVARIRALEAEVARKDEALRPFAKEAETTVRRHLCLGPDIDHWPIGDNKLTLGHLRAARAALGPWMPTHQHENGTLAREVVRAQFGVGADGIPVVILDDVFHRPFVVAAEKVKRGFRPLTPDEARVAMAQKDDA